MRAAIVLAAGRSRRFGRADKLFAPLAGEPLVLHAIRAARAAPAGRVLVVTTQPARVRAIVRRSRLHGVVAVRIKAAEAPLSASLRCGLAALRPTERDAFIFLGDMPGVGMGIAAQLTRRAWRGFSAVRPQHRGVPGHPVFVRQVRAQTIRDGDAGFRFAREDLGWISAGPGSVGDVDRRGDLARARSQARAVRRP
jgi:molybdenum cofactor cytidylyltransferase